MGMWVRTQDRKILLEINYVELGQGEEKFYLLGKDSANNGWRLAEYDTEERALEIMDEIDRIKACKYDASLNYEKFQQKLSEDKELTEEEILYIYKSINTFQMPEE